MNATEPSLVSARSGCRDERGGLFGSLVCGVDWSAGHGDGAECDESDAGGRGKGAPRRWPGVGQDPAGVQPDGACGQRGLPVPVGGDIVEAGSWVLLMVSIGPDPTLLPTVSLAASPTSIVTGTTTTLTWSSTTQRHPRQSAGSGPVYVLQERKENDGCPVRRGHLHAGVHGPGRHGVEYSQCCCCAPAVAHCFACSESGQCCGGRDLDADLVIHQRDRVYGKRRLERYTRHERICNDRRFVRHDQVHVDVYGPRWFRVANRQRERDAQTTPKKSGGGGAIDYALLSLLLGVGLRFGRRLRAERDREGKWAPAPGRSLRTSVGWTSEADKRALTAEIEAQYKVAKAAAESGDNTQFWPLKPLGESGT